MSDEQETTEQVASEWRIFVNDETGAFLHSLEGLERQREFHEGTDAEMGVMVKGEHAIRRTAPLAAFVYAIVVITYIKMDRADSDVARARKAAPWYTKKSTPSVIDMLAALRRDLLARRLSPHPGDRSARAKILQLLPWDLMAAA